MEGGAGRAFVRVEADAGERRTDADEANVAALVDLLVRGGLGCVWDDEVERLRRDRVTGWGEFGVAGLERAVVFG